MCYKALGIRINSILTICFLHIIGLIFLNSCSVGHDFGNVQIDAAPPQDLSLTINGEDSIDSRTVTVDLSAEDDTAITGYYVSEEPQAPSPDDARWAAIEPVGVLEIKISHELSEGYGEKTLYAFVRDSSNNVSSTVSSVKRVVVGSKTANPNVVMIVVDTLRADHLPAWGYARDTAPNIAEFAGQSVVFKNAIAPAAWTYPSYASMLLGKFAFNHEHNVYEKKRIEEGAALPIHMKYKGYATVSLQTNVLVEYLDADFDERFQIVDGSNLDQQIVQKAVKWLDADANKDRTFFMFVGLISPHWDYDPGRSYLYDFVNDDVYASSGNKVVSFSDGIAYTDLNSDVQACIAEPLSIEGIYQDSRLYVAAYDSEIRFADYSIGVLLESLKAKGLYDDSLIIITADHGENMTDHTNYFSHGDNLYNSLLHVPLLIKFPGQTESLSVDEYVRTIDALPTVLDYLNLDVDSLSIDGKSLIPVVNGQDVNFGGRPVISYIAGSWDHSEKISLIKDGYKLIKTGDETELFDLALDPNEQRNIAGLDTDRVNSFNIQLNQYYSAQ
ncbi:MAG: sulfatase [Deltaproteobacteria bacterium]